MMIMKQNIQTIENFFKYVKMNDYYSIMKLFSRDAIVYEPFSKENGISGMENLISFFKIMCRASGDLNQDLDYQNVSNNDNNVVVSVISTYTKGDSITARFTFYFQLNRSNKNNNKENLYNSPINTLNIEFL